MTAHCNYWENLMRTLRLTTLWAVLAIALISGCVTSQQARLISQESSVDLALPAKTAAYPVVFGDVLDISVWGDESMNRRVVVRSDGGISYPLAGDVQVAGLTVAEIGAKLAGLLREYLPDSEVTVSFVESRGNMVFVVGRVQRPGGYPLVGPMTPIQALALAGGLTPFASARSIKIIRVLPGGGQKSYAFDYTRVESGNTDQLITLQPGDTLLVP